MFQVAHPPLIPSAVFMALVAVLAAHLGGTSLASRTRPFFVGGCSPASRCLGGMAAANTVFPAAKSANYPSSRRQSPQPRAVYACSRRQ